MSVNMYIYICKDVKYYCCPIYSYIKANLKLTCRHILYVYLFKRNHILAEPGENWG